MLYFNTSLTGKKIVILFGPNLNKFILIQMGQIRTQIQRF